MTLERSHLSKSMLSSLVQTRSIELVLAPIATQVSQLIIANESCERRDGQSPTWPNLVPSAEQVMNTLEELVSAAEKATQESADEELLVAMPAACEMLSTAGRNTLLAAQNLQTESVTPAARAALVQSLRNVLQGTMKVLLVWDDAEVRKIVHAAHWVLERVNVMMTASNMKGLVACFKGFSEAVMLLANLTDKRQQELTNPRQRERTITAMMALKKSVPMLSTAMQTYVKYPNNPQAKASRDYVANQVRTAAREIVAAVENRNVDDDEMEEPGHFALALDKVIRMLSSDDPQFLPEELDSELEAVVRHAMLVAHESHTETKDQIVRTCKKVFKIRNEVAQLLTSVEEHPEFLQLRNDFSSACNDLIGEADELDKLVSSAVLQQVVDTFVETTEPLERLLRAAAQGNKSESPVTEKVALTLLGPHIDDFTSHLDQLLQLASFAAASSMDSRRVRIVRSSIRQLESLDPEVQPTVLALCRNPSDKASVEHVKLVRREWFNEVNSLVTAVDEMLNTKEFMEVTEESMEEDIHQCKDAMHQQDEGQLKMAAATMMGRTRRVIQITSNHIDNSDDPIYRNGLLAWVKQLEKAMIPVKTAANKCVANMSDVRAHDSLAAASQELLTVVSKVKDALQGMDHPEILSPMREGLRSSRQTDAEDSLLALPLPDLGNLHVSGVTMATNQPMESSANPQDSYLSKALPHGLGVNNLSSPTSKKTEISIVEIVPGLGLPSPVKELVRAAAAHEATQVEVLCSRILARTNQVTGVVNSLIGSVKDHKQAEKLQSKSAEFTRVTPRLLELAKRISTNQSSEVEELHRIGGEWANQLTVLQPAVDSLIGPWTAPVSELARIAKDGNINFLMKELDDFHEIAKRLKSLASTAAQAVALQKQKGDPQLARTIHLYGEELESLASSITGAANSVVSDTVNKAEVERLDGLCTEWSGKVVQLLSSVDSVTTETAMPIKVVATAANTGSDSSVEDSMRALLSHVLRLRDMASCASEGYTNHPMASMVTQTFSAVDTLGKAVEEVARLVAARARTSLGTTNSHVVLRMELLQREWATKVLLLHGQVDGMTSEMSAPLDRLAGAALAVYHATGQSRLTLLQEFQNQADKLSTQVSKTRQHCQQAMTGSAETGYKETVQLALDTLSRVTAEIITATRDMADTGSTDSAVSERFQDLKRQWGCKALLLYNTLRAMTGLDQATVTEVMTSLLGTSNLPSFARVNMADVSPDTSLNLSQIFGSPQPAPGFSTSPSWSTLPKWSHTPSPVRSRPSTSPDSSPRSPRGPMESYMGHSQKSISPAKPSREIRVTPNMLGMQAVPEASLGDIERSTPPRQLRSPFEPSSIRSPNTAQTAVSNNPSELDANQSSKTIVAAALSLQQEVDKWEEENNTIVKVAKTMSQQMQQMAEYTRGHGKIRTKEEFINTAKAIAANGKVIHKFAKIIAKFCIDRRCSEDLVFYANHVPSMGTQLSIIASVKAATPHDKEADAVLVKNAENLMHSVTRTLIATESACVKGLHQPPEGGDEAEAAALATQWQRKLQRHRMIEASSHDTDDLGLRRINRHVSAPTLTEILGARAKILGTAVL
ncbi:catenin alpha-1-like isoform X2 [Branchiostoma floridae]|uniref:Catenin alpha-1-like isoform X2 n=1 Tax=Branchiostoma floridae TaxID=7739 RepID=A0A9J7KY48_BRAFL|nr:catenin alpha-1-like isoform X2 [Branchiostoma floridae]